jgi:AcrR family transcriptional regulator
VLTEFPFRFKNKPTVGIKKEFKMARTKANYQKRRKEILKEIWKIFMKYGYENTTLSLIIEELSISKGAFYHYFPTKEACADAAVDMYAKEYCQIASNQVKADKPANVNIKNLMIFCANLSKENENDLQDINSPANRIFHQKLMAALVKEFAPLYAKVISQGIEEKIFNTKFPLETAQMILTLSNFYFDADVFGWDLMEIPKKLLAFEDLLTRTLQAEPGEFSFLQELI